MSRSTLRSTIFSTFLIAALVIGIATNYLLPRVGAHANPVQPVFNHFLSTHYDDDGLYDDNNNGPAQQQYDDRAYPNTTISYDQVIGSYNAFQSVARHPSVFGASGQNWHLVGPTTGNVPAPVTYTGLATTASGRVTAIAISNSCDATFCRVWVGAAGGGIWTTDHGLAQTPDWHPSSAGLASDAIGSIALDPNDPTDSTLYVGTGEPNGSSDSEAGVGLYKSTDGGHSWRLVSGSVAAAKDRSIGAIAIDPQDPQHIYIGTDVARHGSSSVNGGRFSPPHAPVIGLYESTNGGATFSLVFSKESDVVNPTSPNGSDFFRGGITKIQFDRTGLSANQPSVVYFSVFDYGLYCATNSTFEQVFASVGGGTVANSAGARTEFALAPNGSKLRIYLGDTDGNTADFYRVDDANIPASTLTNGTSNPGWLKLSNATKGTPGYASYDFCNTQCSYDMWVATRLGRLFISTNADAAAASVTFTRIDTSAQPNRFISGIAVDPANPYHAFVSFSGYNAYTPATPGHVFDVLYDPTTGKATWTDISYNLGDAPITGIAYDSQTGDLYISNDFGVLLLPAQSTTWATAAPGLPMVAVYSLTISTSGRILYAATHGRGAWQLNLP